MHLQVTTEVKGQQVVATTPLADSEDYDLLIVLCLLDGCHVIAYPDMPNTHVVHDRKTGAVTRLELIQ